MDSRSSGGTSANDEVQNILSSILNGEMRCGDPVSVQDALAALVAAMGGIARKKDALEAEVQELRATVDGLQTTLEVRKTKLTQAEEKTRTLLHDVDNYKEQISILRANEGEKVNKIHELNEIIKDKESSIQKFCKAHCGTQFKAEEGCSLEEHLTLESQLADAMTEISVLKEKKQRYKEKITTLKEAKKTLRSQHASAQGEIEKLKEEKDNADVTIRTLQETERNLRKSLENRMKSEQSVDAQGRFYLTPEFLGYMKNLPSPEYPEIVENIGPCQMDVEPFAKLQPLPFLTLDSRLVRFQGRHAMAYCTSPEHESALGRVWYPCNRFREASGRQVELFIRSRANLKYMGSFQCRSTLEWSKNGATKPDRICSDELVRASQILHPDSLERVNNIRLLDGYAQGSLKVDTLLLQCLGFNGALYDILMAAGQMKQGVSVKRVLAEDEQNAGRKRSRTYWDPKKLRA